jgi:hypothetical protein
MADTFEFSRAGRTPGTLAILIVIYAVLIGAVVMVDAAWWLMAGLALLTLPALWDLWRDPCAGLRLDHDRLDWHSGRRTGSVALNKINHMRFDTRLDFSVRVTAILNDEKRIRLPYEVLPPHKEFEETLLSQGITVERHHFTIF